MKRYINPTLSVLQMETENLLIADSTMQLNLNSTSGSGSAWDEANGKQSYFDLELEEEEE